MHVLMFIAVGTIALHKVLESISSVLCLLHAVPLIINSCKEIVV